jgi:fucose permease
MIYCADRRTQGNICLYGSVHCSGADGLVCAQHLPKCHCRKSHLSCFSSSDCNLIVAVKVSLIGMLLGPLFPLIIGHSTRIFPNRLLTAIIGCISAVGMSGSAMLPFITGVLAGKYGIGTLQPLYVGWCFLGWSMVDSFFRTAWLR